VKKHRLLVLAATIAGMIAPLAHADTFLEYSTPNATSTITFDGTTLTGTAIPVTLDYLDPVTGAPATGTLNFSANVAGSAQFEFSAFDVVPLDDITFSITSGPTNILSATLSTGSIFGNSGGFSFIAPNLGGTATATSDLYSSINGLNFNIGIGDVIGDLSISTDGTLSSFDATAETGAFSATDTPTIKSVSSVPEPSSIALLGTGLMTLVGAARRKLAA
jgi:hypothetical protein